MKRIVPFCLVLLSCTFVYSAGAQVVFVAKVSSIDQESDRVALLKMSLIPEVDVLVQVTNQTEIKNQGQDPITISDLAVGDFLKVEGLFTSEGVLAQDIETVGDKNAFAEQQKPSLSEFPKQLVGNFKELFSSNNLNPLLIGLGGTGVARFFDHKINQPEDGFHDFKKIGQVGENMGKQRFIVPAITGFLVVSHFSPNDRFRSMSMVLAQGWVLNNALTYALKGSFHRRRPDDKNHLSFPSGHTSNAFMWATVMSEYYGHKVAIPAYATATFIGLTRIGKSAHYMSDVVAGATLGYIVGRTVARGLKDPERRIIWLPSVTQNDFGISVKVDF
ncbi:phosphatase PAP2 family protein [Acidobacteria bacterium AH-259-D05]|nr:phosphatase PAP2 family protein [Acidobacteria bacterium AH-259-D05]